MSGIEDIKNKWPKNIEAEFENKTLKRCVTQSIGGEVVEELQTGEIYHRYHTDKYNSWPNDVQLLLAGQKITKDVKYIEVRNKQISNVELYSKFEKFAYFCGRVNNNPTDPTEAEKFAAKHDCKLWKPKDEVLCEYPIGALKCKWAIDNCEFIVCSPSIGNDCSWELGYGCGIGKKIYVIGTLAEEDWMTKIGVSYAS